MIFMYYPFNIITTHEVLPDLMQGSDVVPT